MCFSGQCQKYYCAVFGNLQKPRRGYWLHLFCIVDLIFEPQAVSVKQSWLALITLPAYQLY